MTARVGRGDWNPIDGALPTAQADDTVYVVPTHPIIDGKIDKYPLYTEHVRYLPKAARAESAPVAFSIPEDGRSFISEFSADVETCQLALAVVTILNDWLIFTVGAYIGDRARSRGDTIEHAEKLPLRVTVAETGKKGRPLRTFTVKGAGGEVIEALRELQAQERKSREKSTGAGVLPAGPIPPSWGGDRSVTPTLRKTVSQNSPRPTSVSILSALIWKPSG